MYKLLFDSFSDSRNLEVIKIELLSQNLELDSVRHVVKNKRPGFLF